ncbi:hypothetical protein T492DRAFT_562613, partial [Pavlovales sp. CCMP2436]
DDESDGCVKCGEGGSLLLCDSCPRAFHLGCLHPVLETVPTGKWTCPHCAGGG